MDTIIRTLASNISANLLKLNELRLNVLNSEVSAITIDAHTNFDVIQGNGKFSNNTQHYDWDSGQKLTTLSEGNSVISCDNKYNITAISAPLGSIQIILGDLYLPKIVELVNVVTNSIGELSLFKQAQVLTKFDLVGLTGDIKNLENNTSLTYIGLNNCNGVYGNIEALGKLTSLESLRLKNTTCNGFVENMLDAMVDNGRTTGTLEIQKQNSGIVYNGKQSIYNRTFQFDANGWSEVL